MGNGHDSNDRILFVCSTKLLLFNALHVRMHMFPKARADIIFDFSRPDTEAIVERLKKTGLFENVAYRMPEKLDLKEYFSRLRNNQPVPSIFTAIRNSLKKHNKKGHFSGTSKYLIEQICGYENIDLGKYTHIFGQGNTETIRSIVAVVKEANKSCKLCILEEGVGSYVIDEICRDVKGDYIYVYDPEVIMYDCGDRARTIDKIDKADRRFLDCINQVFDYHVVSDVTDKIIFFDDYVADMPAYLKKNKLLSKTILRNSYKKHLKEMQNYLEQKEFFDLLCQYRDDRKILVKLHPTTKRDTVEADYLSKNNVSIFEPVFIPWEVVCLNNDIRDNIIVTMGSSAVRSNSIFSGQGDTNRYIILHDAMTSDNKNKGLYSQLFKKWSEEKNIRGFFPKNSDEYIDTLKQVFSDK